MEDLRCNLGSVGGRVKRAIRRPTRKEEFLDQSIVRLTYSSISEFVQFHFVGESGAILRVDVTNVLSEDFQSMTMFFVGVLVSVFVLEVIERRLKIIFAVTIDVFAHRVEENAWRRVFETGTRKTGACHR